MNLGITLSFVALMIFTIVLLVRDMVVNDQHKQREAEWERHMAKADVKANRAEARASKEETKRLIVEVEMENRIKQLEGKLSHVANLHSEEIEKIKEAHKEELQKMRAACDAELAAVYRDYKEECRMHEILKEAHARMLEERREVA